MSQSGLFKFARCRLQEEEMLSMVRLFTLHFPSFVPAEQWAEVKRHFDEQQIRETFRRAGAGLVTPFSSLGTNYFVADPLGLMELASKSGQGFTEFTSFDLEWGSGNHFFSKDHKALLIISEPKQPAADYQFAERVVQWTRSHVPAADPSIHTSMAGAYIYAEQDHKFIDRNIRLISWISIIGNLVLCLLVYPRVPLLLLSLLPTSLGILWTTGIISYYPGAVNLISLSFIAILAGLGDDQVIHFFNRVPQEWARGGSLDNAITRTFETTGHSILFCILTMSTSTAALAMASFKALSEFGFVLTVGLAMLLLHTVFTVPALMRLWWRVSKPRAPESVTFRFLPAVARRTANFVGAHQRLICGISAAAFLLSVASLPGIRMDKKIEIVRSEDNPAIAGQKRLAEKFGIEGTPEVFLIDGAQQDVLRRAERLTAALEPFKRRGALRAIISPAQIVPSAEMQTARAKQLAGIDLGRAARVLEESVRANGFREEPFRPVIARLRELQSQGAQPLSVESVGRYLPRGMLDNSIARIGDNSYVAAIAFFPADVNAAEVIPETTIRQWQREFGGFAEFSFNKINRDLQAQVLRDSRRALFLTVGGVILIIYLCFRSIRISLLALMPIAFAVIVTFGLLAAVGHRFSFMSITALPLIVGIGIDNSIHLVRRYLENDRNSILEIAKSSGAALIQSNLTTIVGFGALMASSFEPLAEMGLVTALGVILALMASLWSVPAIILVFGLRPAPEITSSAA
jgi:predicted RND superfamily exporter protein